MQSCTRFVLSAIVVLELKSIAGNHFNHLIKHFFVKLLWKLAFIHQVSFICYHKFPINLNSTSTFVWNNRNITLRCTQRINVYRQRLKQYSYFYALNFNKTYTVLKFGLGVAGVGSGELWAKLTKIFPPVAYIILHFFGSFIIQPLLSSYEGY